MDEAPSDLTRYLPATLLAKIEAQGTHVSITLVAYPGIGHLPMEEAPDRSAADLARFVDGLNLRRETAQL